MMRVDFNTLPTEIQEQAKETLKAFHEVHITFANGEYNVSTGIALLSNYPDDYRVIGDYKDNEVFTQDEMILNYINTFHEYPTQYKGERNYRWLSSLNWNDEVIFNENHELVVR